MEIKMIDKIKIPLIAGASVFILFFIINIIVGNTFVVIFLRSLISGIIIFALFSGLIFLYENYFLDNIKNSESEAKTDDQGIDIVLDDDIEKQDKSGEADLPINTDESQIDINTDDIYSSQTGDLSDSSDKDEILPNKTEDEMIKNNNKESDTQELNIDNFNVNTDEEQVDTVSSKAENTSSYSNYPGINSDGKTLKDKIGFDMSYDDVAKAIRTKFKEE